MKAFSVGPALAAARILSLAYIGFLSLFSLDVLSEGVGWSVVVPLMIHLLPAIILLLLVAVAWKYYWVGALTFGGMAIGYIFLVGFDRPWSWYAAISGPALVIGLLYFTSWLQVRQRDQR